MTVNITRHDRGLDSKRIEKIIDMIEDRANDFIYDHRDTLSERKKELKKEIIEKYDLQKHYDSIESINGQVKELEKQIRQLEATKEPHQIEISKIMRGSEQTYDYSRIRDDSPADDYIKERIPNMDDVKKQLTLLKEDISEKLWLAKDIEEARDLHSYAINQIQTITKGI